MAGPLHTSLGVFLIGVFFNTYLYGIVTLQYASYYTTIFNDPAWIKLFVFVLFALDTFHSASVIYMAWIYCVDNLNNLPAPVEDQWPYPFTVIAISMTAFLTHMFLAYRVLRITRSKLLYSILVFVSVAAWVTGIVCGKYVWTETLPVPTEDSAPMRLVIAWLCLEVGADMLVTGVLAWALSRSRSGFHKSDTVVNRLIRGSVQTGLFAAIFSVLSLVFVITRPGQQFFGLFGIPVSRIYSNTLMDTLLVRNTLRKRMNNMTGCETGTDSIWILKDQKTDKLVTQNSVHMCIRREIHTDAKPHSQTSCVVDTVEESRVPTMGGLA